MSLAQALMGSKKPTEKKEETTQVDTEVESSEMNAAPEADSSESAPETTVEASSEESEDMDSLKKRTAESLADEVEKLRKENAKRRKKEQEAKEAAAQLFAAEREQLEAELAAAKSQLGELDKLKQEKASVEVDKSVEAKERSEEIKSIIDANKQLQKQLEEIKNAQKAREEAEAEEKSIREQAVRARFNEEIKSIPEDKRRFAESIFNGAQGDAQEKLFTFLEAKREGLFGKKQVQVVHKPVNSQPVQETKNQEKIPSKLKIKRGLSERLKNGLTVNQRLTK
jgi:hypothetical protein